FGDGALQLRVVAFAHELGVLNHFDIGRDAVAFHFPVAVEIGNGGARCGDSAAIEQHGRTTDADQTTPGAHADERADFRLAEKPGHGVTARTGELIDDHHLRTVDRHRRIEHVLTFARGDHVHRLAAKIVDDVVGELAAVIEALIENGALLANLREEVAVEIRIAAPGGVRQINVGEFSTARLVHFAAIGFDPVKIAKRVLAGNGDDGDVAGARAVRIRTDLEDHLLAGGFLEQLVDFVRGGEVLAADGEQIFARLDVDAGLGERRLEMRVPVFATVDFLEAVAAVFDGVVGAEQADADVGSFWLRAPAHEHVADGNI